MVMTLFPAALLLCFAFTTACGADPGTEVPAATPSQTSSSSAIRTPSDVTPIDETILDCGEIDDAGGLDLPPPASPEPDVIPTPEVQVAHEQIDALRRWAQTQHPATFGDVWINGDALVVAFTDDVEERRPEVDARFTAAPVHVVQVRYSVAELEEVHASVAALLESQDRTSSGWIYGVGTRTNLNRVAVDGVGDRSAIETHVASVAPPDAVCLQVQPAPGPEDAIPTAWSLPPGQEPTAEDTAVHLWVHEMACAGGQPATGRVVVQDIALTEEAVTITLGVIPVAGVADCPSNPPTPFTVELDERLGDRTVIDGSNSQPTTSNPSSITGTPTTAEPPGPQPTGTVTPSPTTN